MFKNRNLNLSFVFFTALFLYFFLSPFLSSTYSSPTRLLVIFIILIIGAFYVLNRTAKIIEETTEVLSEKTRLAGGLLQSFGTAFPDMIMGIVAAFLSLRYRSSNYSLAINYAILAAATTFGSNIYNIGYAVWCVFRQNLANRLKRQILLFPAIRFSGHVTPLHKHLRPPLIAEVDASLNVLNSLTILTAVVVFSMVIFGKVTYLPTGFIGDLYQLIRPAAVIIAVFCLTILIYFRKTPKGVSLIPEINVAESFYRRQNIIIVWLHLLVSGIAILFSATAMIHALQIFSEITGTPTVITGVLSGIIGCLGEILVIHNFTVNANGRIGDALVGIAMDNIVTILGASVVAVVGGIYLGGNALILIFVLILALNSTLLWQISQLKNHFIS